MKAKQMREVLNSHRNFKNKKSWVECFLVEERTHIVYMLPKFHCELNPMPEHTVNTALRAFKTPSHLPLTLSQWRIYKITFERLGITCLPIYLEGGSDLKKLVKDYKVIESHRRISEFQ